MMTRTASIFALIGLLAWVVSGQSKQPGGFAGRVVWTGEPFPPREVLWQPSLRGNDVVLERMLVNRVVMDESLVVDPLSQGIRDVVIYLPDFRLPGKSVESVELTLENLAVSPRVLTLGGRTKLVVQNRDPLAYDLIALDPDGNEQPFHFEPKSRREIELPKGQRIELHGTRFEFMAGTVFRPGDVPAIITAADGHFAVNGLDAAEIRIEFEHELLGHGSRTIELQPGKVVQLELTQADFAAKGQEDFGTPFSRRDDARYRIEGLPVPRADFEAVVAFLGARHYRFGLPRSLLENHALKQVLVPLAATFAHYRSEIPRLEGRAAAFSAALEQGESFTEAARRLGEAAEGIRVEPFGRQDIDPWLGARLFASPRKIPIGPIWSTRGLHFFYIDEVEGTGSEEKRAGYQAFFAWDPLLPASDRLKLVKALADRARIEPLEPRRRILTDEIKPR